MVLNPENRNKSAIQTEKIRNSLHFRDNFIDPAKFNILRFIAIICMNILPKSEVPVELYRRIFVYYNNTINYLKSSFYGFYLISAPLRY